MVAEDRVGVCFMSSGSSPAVSSTNESFQSEPGNVFHDRVERIRKESISNCAVGCKNFGTDIIHFKCVPGLTPSQEPVDKIMLDWHRQTELAGLRQAPYDPRSRWERLGMWRLIATIVQRRSLRAWQRLRWRMANRLWNMAWIFLPTTQHEMRWGWLGIKLHHLSFWLRYPEYDDERDGF
jgi:hypothetical protein